MSDTPDAINAINTQPSPPQQQAPSQLTSNPLAERLNDLLPQTQCTRCGYPSCRDYALALAAGETELNRCPPGGSKGIKFLAAALEKPVLPLDPACGIEGPRLLAWIDPAECIGCVKCILACPADAIIGGPKRMHTVLPALCTGCELCVAPCPVDCIEIFSSPDKLPWSNHDALEARARFEQRNARRERAARDDHDRFGAQAESQMQTMPLADPNTDGRKRSIIEAAIAKAKARQQARQTSGDKAQ